MLSTNEVRIETSTICNYSCFFCPYKTSFSRYKEIMSNKSFFFLVDKIKSELPHITDITLSGLGEMFMDPNILEKIKYCKNNGFNIHILTNGSLLNEYIIEKLNKLQVEEIRISLHSIHYEEYNKITGANKSQYKRVLDNIDFINTKTTLRCVLTFILEDSNYNIIEIENYFKKYKNIIIEIWKPHNWVDDFKYRRSDIESSTCGRPFSGPYQIQIDGTLTMCCFDYNGKIILGDFFNQTMKEIFNDKVYIDLKKHHEKNTLNETSYICKDCDQRKNKSNILIYNNKFNINDRIERTSTRYEKFK